MKEIGILILLFSILFKGSAQDVLDSSPIATITVSDSDLLSFDTRDQLYLSNAQGDLYLFDENGDQINYFSPLQQGRLQQLEAAWTVTVFTFSEDRQEFRILDRFLNPVSEGRYPFPEVNLAKASTLGNANIIWIWDESDFSLKRMDYRRKAILDQQPLNLILNQEQLVVVELREIKNRLFMNTRSAGVFIFDNQANLLEKLSLPSFDRICYFKDRLLWVEGQEVWFYHLPTGKTEVILDLKGRNAKEIQLGQERMALIYPDRVELFLIPEALKKLN
ncbi:MAG: hypothetical protein ACQEW9_04575 [Bacteroidota bacterium]